MSENFDGMNFGNYPVTEIQHFMLNMHDGVELACKIWLPCLLGDMNILFPCFAKNECQQWAKQIYPGKVEKETDNKFPCILEYLPYAKDSAMTLQRDHARHPWFCSYGYADIRVDLRGTGASSGYYYDEYDEQEITDGVEIIEWIAKQTWSNGRVGMYGKSWGGFNGLQLAYTQPPALCGVISLYSTDNRFTDDVHYQGDTIVGDQMLSWASNMFLFNSRPMHPRYFNDLDAWKEAWLKRLNKTGQSFLSTWLSHQHKGDPYWQHGSICENPKKLKCPVLIIGGYADGYTNAAFRMAATLNENTRTIIGPWDHQWPDTAAAGPNIDYLGVCLKWWDCYLKDKNPSVPSSWPRLSLYIRDAMKPDEICGSPSGKWVCLNEWNNKYEQFQNITYETDKMNIHSNTVRYIFFGPSMSLKFHKAEAGIDPVPLLPHALQGVGVGSWFCMDYGFPEDQSIANDHSHCWISDILTSNLVIAGFGKLFVCVEAETCGKYALQIRVCDQLPSGESTLISRGCQNLNAACNGWGLKMPGREKKIFCIQLNGVGHTFESGHRLLVSITPSCYPSMYPPVNNKGLKIYPFETKVVFQTLSPEELCNTTRFETPKPLLALPVIEKTDGSYCSSRCNNRKTYLFEVTEKSGLQAFPTMCYEYEESAVEKFKTDEKVTYGLMTAERSAMSAFTLSNDQSIKTVVQTSQEMSGEQNCFHIRESLKVTIEDELFFTKTWENVIPRKYV